MFKSIQKTIAVFVLLAFFVTSVNFQSYAQVVAQGQEPWMPMPGTMVSVSPSFEPALIRGLMVHQDNPFLFDFIVDPGQSNVSREALKEESDRMIKYFFASLTLPDRDIWVNLSPYEKDRMIPESLGVTTMGRDLLAQDYMLKQLTASLIYPQHELGKTFWAKVYAKAQAMYGTTQIPVNTFNKVWIVPQKAGIYERGQTAFIVSGHLKVMLEEDYLSLTKHVAISHGISNNTHSISSNIIRQIILPEIEKEVNEGKNFATLRQIFYAQVLAVWFKRNLKQALFNQVYANKSTVKGIDQNDAASNEAIYRQYLKAYKKGVFNYIQDDVDPVTQEALPRKYFSGGYGQVANMAMVSVPLTAKALGEAAKSFIISVFAANRLMAASWALRSALGLGLLVAVSPAFAQKPVLLDGKYQQPWSNAAGAYAEAMHSPASLPHGYIFKDGDSIKVTFKTATAVGTNYEFRLLPEPNEQQRKKGDYGSTEIGLAHHLDAETGKDTTIFKVRKDRTETFPVSMFKYKKDIIVISVHSGNEAWENKALNPDGRTVTIQKIELISGVGAHHDHILNLLRNELNIQDPNVAIYRQAFTDIEGLKGAAYDDLKQIVLNKEVTGDSLKWAAYLAAELAPTKEEAKSFLDQVNNGPFEWYVKQEAENGFKARHDQAMAMVSRQDRIILDSDLDAEYIAQINRELERLRHSTSTSQVKQEEGAVKPIFQMRDIIELTSEHITTINQLRAASKSGKITIVVVPNGLDIYDAAMTYEVIKESLYPYITSESGKVLFKDRGEVIVKGSKREIQKAIDFLESNIRPNGKIYKGLERSTSVKILNFLRIRNIITLEELKGADGEHYGTAEQLADFYTGLNVLKGLVKDVKLKGKESGSDLRTTVYLVVGTILALAFLGAFGTILRKAQEEEFVVDWRKQIDEDKAHGTHQPDVKWYRDGDRNISIASLEGRNSGKSLRFNFLEQHAQNVQVTPVLSGGWVKGSTSIKVGSDGIAHLNVPSNEDWEGVIIENDAKDGRTFNDHINPVYARTSEGEVRSFLPYIAVTVESKRAAEAEGGDKAMNLYGGIDFTQQDSAIQVEKDANGGVKVNVDPAMIARIEREGLHEVVPVIINMRPADVKAMFGVVAV